ncbi:hypothetical protein LTR95_002522 [Oleoguttula sp. CCFEE 5521]
MVDHGDIRQRHRVQASREDIPDSSNHDSREIVQAPLGYAAERISHGQVQEAQQLIKSAVGRAMMEAFEEVTGSRQGDVARRHIHGVSQSTTSFRDAARRMMYSLCRDARRSQADAIRDATCADWKGKSAVRLPMPVQRKIAQGGRSMYELSQGAQGFQADSRTDLSNGAGMHMLVPVQPAYTTILDIVNETRLPHFRFLDLHPSYAAWCTDSTSSTLIPHTTPHTPIMIPWLRHSSTP